MRRSLSPFNITKSSSGKFAFATLKDIGSVSLTNTDVPSVKTFTQMYNTAYDRVKKRDSTPLSAKQRSLNKEQFSQLFSQVIGTTTDNISPEKPSSMGVIKSDGKHNRNSSIQLAKSRSAYNTLRASRSKVAQSSSLNQSSFRHATMTSQNLKQTDTSILQHRCDSQRNTENAEILEELKSNKPRNRFTSTDSKLDEIQVLRRQNLELARKNVLLKKEIKQLDEFRTAMLKDVSIENFQEKRVDLLKAQVARQRKYINDLTKTIKFNRIFYKEIRSILEFLVSLEEKYIKNGEKINFAGLNRPETNENKQVILAILNDVTRTHRTTEEFEAFITNFNTVYRNLRDAKKDDVDFEKAFKFQQQQIYSSRQHVEPVANPCLESPTKIKYTRLLDNFMNKYNRLFPFYSVFDEFEYQDKAQFSNFVNSLLRSSARINEMFERLNKYDLNMHNPSIFNENIPKIVRNNTVQFDEFMNSKNKIKRTYLDGEYIRNLEGSLAFLLEKLIGFHNVLHTDKENISSESIMNLSGSLRKCIEQLLCAGLSVESPGKSNEIVVVSKVQSSTGSANTIMSGSLDDLEPKLTELYFEVLTDDSKNQHKAENISQICKSDLQKIRRLLRDLKGDVRSNAQDSLDKIASGIDLLMARNKELTFFTKLQGMELEHSREYLNLLSANTRVLLKKLEEQNKKIEGFFDGIHKDFMEVSDICNMQNRKPPNEHEEQIINKDMKQVVLKALRSIEMVFNNQRSPFYLEIRELDLKFKDDFDNIRRNLLFYSKKVASAEL